MPIRRKKPASTLPSPVYEKYENCSFCQGKPTGCIGCKEAKRRDERAREEREADDRRLQESLLISAHYDNPEEMAVLTEVMHRDNLTRVFDSSDITDEQVIGSMAAGPISGEAMLSLAAQVACQNQSPWGPRLSEGELRQKVLEEQRRKLAAVRGDQRIREQLAARGVVNGHLQTSDLQTPALVAKDGESCGG